MNEARLLLTAGLVAGIFAAGNAAAGPASDRGGDHDWSKDHWRKEKAGEGRTIPVRRYESWSGARAGHGLYHDSGYRYAVYGPGGTYSGETDGDALDLAAATFVPMAWGAFPYAYGYDRYANGCVMMYRDFVGTDVRVREPCP